MKGSRTAADRRVIDGARLTDPGAGPITMNIPPIDSLAALTLAIVLFGVGRNHALRAELSRVVEAFRAGLQSDDGRLKEPMASDEADATGSRTTTRK